MPLHEALLAPFLDFVFMRRALVGCIALSLAAAPVGVFLMLRRLSLTGDAMAHAILPGAAVGFLVAGLSLPAMTLGGFGAGIAVALLSGLVARTTILKEDASLAAFYLLSLALGVLLVSLRGSNVDLMNVLFGTVLALDDPAILLLAGIATASLLGLAVIWRGLVLECLDPDFYATVGRSGAVVHFTFLVLVVLALVGGFQALGTLLAVGIMVLPAAAARFWVRTLTAMVVLATLLALVSCLLGLLVSYHWGLPSGPTIILMAGGAYLLSLTCGRLGSLRSALIRVRHLEA